MATTQPTAMPTVGGGVLALGGGAGVGETDGVGAGVLALGVGFGGAVVAPQFCLTQPSQSAPSTMYAAQQTAHTLHVFAGLHSLPDGAAVVVPGAAVVVGTVVVAGAGVVGASVVAGVVGAAVVVR